MNAASTPALPQGTTHHRVRRATRTRPPLRMALNLTSMIDVIFLLLIFFVVTASFTLGEGIITAKLPQGTGTGQSSDPPSLPLNIIVSAAGQHGYRLELEGYAATPMDFRQLHDQLVAIQYDESRNRTAGTHKPDDPVVITPAGAVRWQHVVDVINAVVRARYTNFALTQAQ